MPFLLPLLLAGAQAQAPFPAWLRELSGLERWPDWAPPYVAEPTHDLDAIPWVPPHGFGECWGVEPEHCSFDCGGCVGAQDVRTCTPLSQSFDDGPSEATPLLLDDLRRAKTKTTFFLIGLNAVQHPAIVRREYAEGHLLAAHTWSHRFLPALSNEEIFAELQWSVWAINATAHVVPRYFRPPYGGADERVRAIARQLGLVTVLWDRDTDDWQLEQGDVAADSIVSDVDAWIAETGPAPTRWFQRRPKPQGLMLEHDLHASNIELAGRIRQKLSGQKTVAQCAGAANYQRVYKAKSSS